MDIYTLLDQAGLQLYDALVKEFVQKLSDLAIKYAKIEDGQLKLYISEITDDAEPAYTLELPQPDLSGLMPKMIDAVAGNIVTVGDEGVASDSGIKPEDIVQKADIVDGLEDTSTDAPLSANQGNALKKLIDGIDSDLSLMSESLESLNSGLSTATSDIEKLDGDVETLNTGLSSANKSIKEVEGKINKLTDTVTKETYTLSLEAGILCLDDGKE